MRLLCGFAVTVCFSLSAGVSAQSATQSTGPAAEAVAAYNRVKPNILKSADRMPADDYGYKPVPEIRSFGRVVQHVIEAQLHSCTTLGGGTFDQTKVPAETAGKDALVAGLKYSFEVCDAAYAKLQDGELMQVLTAGPAKRSRIGVAWGNISHDTEQYATLALYLRLKGIAPPSSEK